MRDIYANQMHRVVSGAAPFKGLSNIGAGLQDLLLIPVKVGIGVLIVTMVRDGVRNRV